MISYFAIYSIIKFRLREYILEYHYSIFAPIFSNLLYILIFSTIDRYYTLSFDEVSFIEFLIPGLIIMIVAQESYDNPSASLINSKQIGSFDDFLLAPITRIEIFISYILSQVLIGFFLAIISLFIFSFFVEFENYSFFFFYYLILVIIFFSSLGCIVGFIAFNWDTQSTVSNFFVTPINFLSGTFFSINVLPDNLKAIFIYNPYYYIVSFFRNSFYYTFEFNLFQNFAIFTFVICFFILGGFIFYRGYKVIK